MMYFNTVLMLTFFMFLLALIGLLKKPSNLVRIFISIELIVSASVLNFCYFSNIFESQIGEIFSITAITLSAISFIIAFSIYINNKNNQDILVDE